MHLQNTEASVVTPKLSVSDFVAITNQTLEYAYPLIEIEGEVASFKVNQGKFVFFDIKDARASVGCFMMLFQLRVPIEDGMKVVIAASPKLTQWGKFSLTVKSIRPSGEGSIKKSFELLKAKLDKEGLFDSDRKRPLPAMPQHVAVISSMQAAGYADFIRIVGDRWGGLAIDVAHVAVQGADAPEQIEKAITYFNERPELPEVIVIIRGGGSADDLAAFNDEKLVRAVAASRVPVLTGIGHETDESLVDLVADVRAATPSNAAQLLVPDRRELVRSVRIQVGSVSGRITRAIDQTREQVQKQLGQAVAVTERQLHEHHENVSRARRMLDQLDPQRVLERGYALVRGELQVGRTVTLETANAIIKAKVEHYEHKD